MMILTQSGISLLSSNLAISVITVLVSGGISFLVAWLKIRFEKRKIAQQHQYDLEKLRAEKQTQFDLEMDKMQAKAFSAFHKPLKYISAREANPYAIMGVIKQDDQKQTVIYRTNTERFLEELNDYLFSEYGQLFIPRKLRRMIYELRGILDDILKKEAQTKNDIIALQKQKIVDRLNELINGDDNIHYLLRKQMGTLNRPLKQQDLKNGVQQ